MSRDPVGLITHLVLLLSSFDGRHESSLSDYSELLDDWQVAESLGYRQRSLTVVVGDVRRGARFQEQFNDGHVALLGGTMERCEAVLEEQSKN